MTGSPSTTSTWTSIPPSRSSPASRFGRQPRAADKAATYAARFLRGRTVLAERTFSLAEYRQPGPVGPSSLAAPNSRIGQLPNRPVGSDPPTVHDSAAGLPTKACSWRHSLWAKSRRLNWSHSWWQWPGCCWPWRSGCAAFIGDADRPSTAPLRLAARKQDRDDGGGARADESLARVARLRLIASMTPMPPTRNLWRCYRHRRGRSRASLGQA